VPWARPDSGFTLLFEALIMAVVSAMPVKAVARMVGEHDTRLWRVVHHYVDQARARIDASDVTQVAIDETAARRGHDYITLFVDIDQARVLFAAEGKDAKTVGAFAADLTAHGGDPEAIEEVCVDMSPAFIKGVAENLPNAAITFDKFHAVKIVNDAVDQVRRIEQKRQGLLRGTRYIWLCVIRPTCPTGSARHCKTCQPAISRPRGPTRYGSLSRNSTSRTHPNRPPRS
jgi:transposase